MNPFVLLGRGLLAFALLLVFSTPTSAQVTVDENNANWGFLVETSTGTGSFVNGPSTPPLGTGSAKLTIDNNSSGLIIGTQQFAGIRFDDFTTLTYSTYSNTTPQTIALQFNVDYDLTDGTTSWQGRLVFEPSNSNTVTPGTWQTWNALNGRWWSSGNPVVGDVGVAQDCPISAPCTVTELLTAYPDMGIQAGALAGLLFKAGSGWAGPQDYYVDNFTIGYTGGGTTTFDFETSVQACPTPAITAKRVFANASPQPYLEIDLDAGPGQNLEIVNFVDTDRTTRFLQGLTASLVSGGLDPSNPGQVPFDDFEWTASSTGSQTATFRLTSDGSPNFAYFVEITNTCEATAYVDPQGAFDAFATSAERTLDLPGALTLEGNYPNPFNPQTVIRYGLAESAEVTLAVYDVMGRQVAVPVAAQMQGAGWHEATFEASHLPSGVYLYRLQAGTQTLTGQMSLLK
ncbi:MAG: T9SS type A sorting domain-containing protein [Bacteroidota bacterium]